MYRAFLRSPSSLFVVFETASGQLAGFAVGALQGQKDRWLAVRFLPQFLWAVVPAILQHPVPVVKRLWARFFDVCETVQMPPGAAVLRSIGVLPSFQGVGAAAYLLQAFEALALRKGAGQVYPAKVRDVVLSVRPGITDRASIEFKDENLILGRATDPNKAYVEEVLPIKLKYYVEYIETNSLLGDVKLIIRTLAALIR